MDAPVQELVLSFINRQDGELLGSNYFTTWAAEAGFYHLSVHPRAARLLVPDCQAAALPEMRTGHSCIFANGELDCDPALEMLFDDGSARPFSIHLRPWQVSGNLAILPGAFPLIACTSDGTHYSWIAHCRRGRFRLPLLKPW
ncbi:hypothetical protein [Rugamonas aquatica]|uniref:Uncharacterized protein n=1 Tax=Rugamonas aquatica TaxID=2743357 RepID=A0A6A7N6U0_9BURK|nr:hypothetical protein [Rugamonas aquatica]MQA40641.1 hypothetical protein [Rugamonas aquatica]